MNLHELTKKLKITKEVERNVLRDIGFQVGMVVEHARTIKCMTQAEFAARIGSTQAVIARIESGSKIPSLLFLKRIADAFDTHIIPPKFGFMEEFDAKVKSRKSDLVSSSKFVRK